MIHSSSRCRGCCCCIAAIVAAAVVLPRLQPLLLPPSVPSSLCIITPIPAYLAHPRTNIPYEHAEREHTTEPWKKTFTVNGAIEPANAGLHFFLPPHVAPLIDHIEKGTFFMLHGARGAGKTTTAMHALRHVRKVHGWLPLAVNMNAVAAGSSEAFWRSVCRALQGDAATYGEPLQSFMCPSSFQAAFSRAVLGDRVRYVLMFDEFDDLESSTVGPRVKEMRWVITACARGGLAAVHFILSRQLIPNSDGHARSTSRRCFLAPIQLAVPGRHA